MLPDGGLGRVSSHCAFEQGNGIVWLAAQIKGPSQRIRDRCAVRAKGAGFRDEPRRFRKIVAMFKHRIAKMIESIGLVGGSGNRALQYRFGFGPLSGLIECAPVKQQQVPGRIAASQPDGLAIGCGGLTGLLQLDENAAQPCLIIQVGVGMMIGSEVGRATS